MSKNSRLKWFKVKLLCRNLSLSSVAEELNITEDELISLVEGNTKDGAFSKWVKDNLGKPYWL